jgi:trehalose 6-phosphate phosphatase
VSKGLALDRLRDRIGADAVFFAGDDVTDETAFVRLRPDDVGVKVGDGDTAAEHRVADPQAVAALLEQLAAARSQNPA